MTDTKNMLNPPRSEIAFNTMMAKPAAAPLTPSAEPLIDPTITPPTIPEIIPAYKGAPDAIAIPNESGMATKNTTILAGISDLKFLNGLKFMYFNLGNDEYFNIYDQEK